MNSSNYKNYVDALANRAATLFLTFENIDGTKIIIDEMENIFKDETKNFKFSDMGAVAKWAYIVSHKKYYILFPKIIHRYRIKRKITI